MLILDLDLPICDMANMGFFSHTDTAFPRLQVERGE